MKKYFLTMFLTTLVGGQALASTLYTDQNFDTNAPSPYTKNFTNIMTTANKERIQELGKIYRLPEFSYTMTPTEKLDVARNHACTVLGEYKWLLGLRNKATAGDMPKLSNDYLTALSLNYPAVPMKPLDASENFKLRLLNETIGSEGMALLKNIQFQTECFPKTFKTTGMNDTEYFTQEYARVFFNDCAPHKSVLTKNFTIAQDGFTVHPKGFFVDKDGNKLAYATPWEANKSTDLRAWTYKSQKGDLNPLTDYSTCTSLEMEYLARARSYTPPQTEDTVKAKIQMYDYFARALQRDIEHMTRQIDISYGMNCDALVFKELPLTNSHPDYERLRTWLLSAGVASLLKNAAENPRMLSTGLGSLEPFAGLDLATLTTDPALAAIFSTPIPNFGEISATNLGDLMQMSEEWLENQLQRVAEYQNAKKNSNNHN